MTSDGVVERIRQFNQGRRPDTLALKYAKLRKSPFAFFRGTAHLFYAYAPLPDSLAAPLAGLTGDLHLENFGAYHGANDQACFSVNDFDEALLGPVAWDLVRFVASLFVGLASLQRDHSEAKALAHDFVETYASAVTAGGPSLADAALLAGPIGAILRAFPSTLTPTMLDELTQLTSSGRQLSLDSKRFLAIHKDERAAAAELVLDFARQNPSVGKLRVLDVARLVAGTSSLGLDRYVVLTAGAGAADGLLELKEVRASCLAPYLHGWQPGWPSQAARVVTAERLFQDEPPARLGWVGDAAKSFVVRDYSRTRDRISLDNSDLSVKGLAETVHTMARITAAGHLRGSAAAGGSGASALQAFARDTTWETALIQFARAGSNQSQADYKEYCAD